MIKPSGFSALIVLTAFALPGAGQIKSSEQDNVLRNLPIVFEPVGDATSSGPAMVAHAGRMTLEMRPGGLRVLPGGSLPDALAITFAGANAAVPEGTERMESTTNYLLGNDPGRWRTHVANFGKVRYRELYPGIDAVFYGTGPRLEHDFIVGPGSDYRKIRLQFPKGAQVSVSGAGVAVHLGGAAFAMEAPVVYQDGPRGREMRTGAFQRFGETEVGFKVDSYDRTLPLVIDPVLNYETYLSQYAEDGVAVATDGKGFTYVTGFASYQFQTTPGGFYGCDGCSGNYVFTFVDKLSADGSKLIYSALLGGTGPGGGSGDAQVTGLAVTPGGDAVVCGWTDAANFPTKGGIPVDSSNNNSYGFLFSLSPDGSALNYGTLIGVPPGTEPSTSAGAAGLALDSAGNAYVIGNAGHGFVVTAGALDNEVQQAGGSYNGVTFLQKYTPGGVLVYSAILGTPDPQSGGGGPAGPSAIAVNAAGEIYVTGEAGSLWPTTSGAYHTTLPANDTYAAPFVARVSADASKLLYSTFLDYVNEMRGIVVLGNGNVFVAGRMADSSYPTTPDAYEPIPQSSASILSELDGNGSSLVYSTAVNEMTVYGMGLAPSGDIWLVGWGGDTSKLKDPLQATVPLDLFGENGSGAMVAQFDPTGQKLKFESLLGGPAEGEGWSIAIDANNHAHVTGDAVYGMYANDGAYLGALPKPAAGYEGLTYAFVAEITPGNPAPAVCADPVNGLNFQTVATGDSVEGSATFTNCGIGTLDISGVSTSLPVYTLTANTCTGQIAEKGTCSVKVHYAPTTNEVDRGWVRIDGNTSMPAFLALNGYGQDEPKVVFSPTSIDFGVQLVGATSPTQKITVTNGGRAVLAIGGVGYSSAEMDDFKFSTTCAISLDPGASCEIDMSFTPAATGAETAAIFFYGSAGNQTLDVTGTGSSTGFGVGTQAGGSTTSTVASGQTATYNLKLAAAGGYSGTVTLGCKGLPAHAACTFQPANFNLTSGQTANFTLSVSTNANSASAAQRVVVFAVPFLFAIFGWRRRRSFSQLMALLLLSLGCMVACGGGSSGTQPPPSSTVAPGTYTLQVVAKDAKSSLTQNVTLVVQ